MRNAVQKPVQKRDGMEKKEEAFIMNSPVLGRFEKGVDSKEKGFGMTVSGNEEGKRKQYIAIDILGRRKKGMIRLDEKSQKQQKNAFWEGAGRGKTAHIAYGLPGRDSGPIREGKAPGLF